MPSCEILITQPKYSVSYYRKEVNFANFATRFTSPPYSDREPSLWQNDFNRVGGILCHIGEKRFELNEDIFFAYGLIKESDCKRFKFKNELFIEVKQLLYFLINSSNKQNILFTTDWQFGPYLIKKKEIPISEFISINNKELLRFNTLYSLTLN